MELPLPLVRSIVAFSVGSMPDYYRGGASGVIEWRIEGPAGGRWQLRLTETGCTVLYDGDAKPDLVLSISDVDFLALVLGHEPPRRLVMQRRLRPRGSLRLGAKLPRLFRFPG